MLAHYLSRSVYSMHFCLTCPKNSNQVGQCWVTPLIPVGRGRQISEIESSLIYRVGPRTVGDTQRNPVYRNRNNFLKKASKKNSSQGCMSFAGDLNGRLEKSQILSVCTLRVSTLPALWTYHVWATGESNGNREEGNNGDGINQCWERKKSTLFSL